jgi:outer membrane protein, heavy metal efflux system
MRRPTRRDVLPLVAALALAQPAAGAQHDHSQHEHPPTPAEKKQEAHEGHEKKEEPKTGHEGHEGHEMPAAGDPATETPSAPQHEHEVPGGHSGHGSHNNVQVTVPELPILPGADPAVDTIPAGPAVRVEEFEQRAAAASPDIARAQAAVEVARGRAKQAGLFPNPVVGYSGEEIQGGEPSHGGQHGFAVDQTIPLGGKLGKRRDVLLGAVKQAEALLEVARFGVNNSVRLAFFDALAAQQRVDLERRMVELLQEAVRTSYGLYNVGQADRPDVLEIEIEARQAQVRLISARSEMDRARQQLAITAADLGATFGRLEGNLEEALRGVENTAVAQILERSPEAAAARAGIERARLAIRSAKAEAYPDLFVTGGARYNREHKEINDLHFDHVGWQGFLEAGISIPIFNRNQGGIAAAEAELRASEAELRRLELGIRSRFATAMARYRDAARVSEAYRKEIIPRAEEAYRLYLEKYQEMQAAYPQVLIARRTMLQSNLDYITAIENLYRAGLPLRGFLIGEGTSGMSGPLLVSSPARGEAEAGRAH